MNAVKQLEKVKKGSSQIDAVELDKEILDKSQERDMQIYESLGIEGFIFKVQSSVNLEDGVYSIQQIQEICNAYDFKFLETSYYKGGFPLNLAPIISEFLEKNTRSYNKEINNIKDFSDRFYIMAPVEMFSTKKHVPVSKDPVLFYKTGMNSYKLVHQWGDDFPFSRVFRIMFKTASDDEGFSNLTGFLIPVAFSFLLIPFIISGNTLSGNITGTVLFAVIWAIYFKIMTTKTYYDGLFAKDEV